MKLHINAKLHSLSEKNTCREFAPNAHGLYNISSLFDLYDTLKEEEARNNPDYQGEYLESFVKAVRTSSNLMLTTFAEAYDMRCFDGVYWGDINAFHYMLKACSNIYADAVNTLDNYYEGKFKLSNKEYGILESKKYATVRIEADTEEGYKSYCIYILAKFNNNLDFVADFTTVLNMRVEELAIKKFNLSGEASNAFCLKCWGVIANHINNFIGKTIELDPNLRDSDSFFIRYRTTLHALVNALDNIQPDNFKQPLPVLAHAKKRGWLDRLFNGE